MAASAELRELDAQVAVAVDGWTEVERKIGVGFRGKPRVGLKRPVIAYSTDLIRAMQVARRAVRSHGAVGNEAHIGVTITADEVVVESYNPSCAMHGQNEFYEGRAERTDSLPELLTRAALHLSRRGKR